MTVGLCGACRAFGAFPLGTLRIYLCTFATLIVADDNELVERIKVVDIEFSLQMIKFMLHGSSNVTVLAELIEATVAILRLDPNAFASCDIGNVTRD